MKGLNQISIDSLHEDVCPNADKRIVTEKIVNARQRENEREEEGDEGNSRQRRGEKKKKKKKKRERERGERSTKRCLFPRLCRAK